MIKRTFIFALALASSSIAFAENFTVSAEGGTWNSPATWGETELTPSNGDTIQFASDSGTLQFASNTSTSSSTFEFNSEDANRRIEIADGVTWTSKDYFNVSNGNSYISSQSGVFDGSVSIVGDPDGNAGTLNFSGVTVKAKLTFSNAENVTVVIDKDSYFSTSGSYYQATGSGNIIVNGAIGSSDKNGKSLYLQNGVNMTIDSDEVFYTNVTYAEGATLELVGKEGRNGYAFTTKLSIYDGGTLVLSGKNAYTGSAIMIGEYNYTGIRGTNKIVVKGESVFNGFKSFNAAEGKVTIDLAGDGANNALFEVNKLMVSGNLTANTKVDFTDLDDNELWFEKSYVEGAWSEDVKYILISGEAIYDATNVDNNYLNDNWQLVADSGNTGYFLNAVVPEPSTYSVIFGAVALGFVFYRRRK